LGEDLGDGGESLGDLATLGETGAAAGGGLELKDPDRGVLVDAVRKAAAGLELHHAAGGGPEQRAALVDVEGAGPLGGAAAEGDDLERLAAPLGGVADVGDDLPDARRRGVDLNGALDGVRG